VVKDAELDIAEVNGEVEAEVDGEVEAEAEVDVMVEFE